ncbi:MAG: fatty acid desaturase [Candidatus Binatia bacterium]
MSSDASPGEINMTHAAWYQSTTAYVRPSLGKSLWQVVNTFVPYFILLALMVITVQRDYPYWTTLMLAVAAGGMLIRVFILFHDCCHGSFFASHRANSILGYVTGVLTFTPFEDWRLKHNRHHATAGDLDRRGVGDIWTMTTAEYLAAPLWQRFIYRFYRNPIVLFGPGATLLFLLAQRFCTKGAGQRERRSVLRTNLMLLVVAALATWTIGWQTYLLVQLPVIVIGGGLGVWLFYVQHQFDNAYWVRHGSWDPLKVALEGSSYFKLPKIFQWLTGNIGLHHIHHVRPNIPNYNLQQCQDEITAFRVVKPITLATSLRSLQLSLFDEKLGRPVSFRWLTTLGARG